ncbi:hypothetical protein GCM10027586_03030 [Kineococcus gypseus]|uniref:SDR family NAD(P)-dependent oxidoreductase n=1 Tax=Kineococcus gypseus TaxID=1637102 RepID=UPI003D7E80AD
MAQVVEASGRLDVVVHNAAHLLHGTTGAFTPEQVLSALDTNTVGALRVNRAALPIVREQGSGLPLRVGSGTSVVVPPFLAPCTAARAATDSFAESISVEVARFGIETSIVVPGPSTRGTAHFPDATPARDQRVTAQYEDLYGRSTARNAQATESLSAPGVVQDVQAVAGEIARIVDLPHRRRPHRTSVDSSDLGDAPVAAVAEVQCTRLLHRMGLADVLSPAATGRADT